MIKSHWLRRAPWLLAGFLLICSLLMYILLSTGLVDEFFLARNRSDILLQVKAASNTTPPDIEFLIDALRGTDWLVSAVAAERLGQLWQSDEITNEHTGTIMRVLLHALASEGHWWRFGWDRDEPEFEQFRGEAIEAASSFGVEILPLLDNALRSDSSPEREASCWIIANLLDAASVDRTTLEQQGIVEHIENLAQRDRDDRVKAACTSVWTTIRASSAP
jgi:hypothetical protein